MHRKPAARGFSSSHSLSFLVVTVHHSPNRQEKFLEVIVVEMQIREVLQETNFLVMTDFGLVLLHLAIGLAQRVSSKIYFPCTLPWSVSTNYTYCHYFFENDPKRMVENLCWQLSAHRPLTKMLYCLYRNLKFTI